MCESSHARFTGASGVEDEVIATNREVSRFEIDKKDIATALKFAKVYGSAFCVY
jgi:hypothetical protein